MYRDVIFLCSRLERLLPSVPSSTTLIGSHCFGTTRVGASLAGGCARGDDLDLGNTANLMLREDNGGVAVVGIDQAVTAIVAEGHGD